MPDNAQILLLYSRQDCHLCDQAEELVRSVIQGSTWLLQKVDIDTDDALVEKYGWEIPVLARAENGEELKWPFPPSRVRALLA